MGENVRGAHSEGPQKLVLCVLCGLPAAGKSTFAGALRHWLQQELRWAVGIVAYDDVMPEAALEKASASPLVSTEGAGRRPELLSCSLVSDSLWLLERQASLSKASLSITNSRSLLRLTSIESVMPSNHLILCRPLLPSSVAKENVLLEETLMLGKIEGRRRGRQRMKWLDGTIGVLDNAWCGRRIPDGGQTGVRGKWAGLHRISWLWIWQVQTATSIGLDSEVSVQRGNLPLSDTLLKILWEGCSEKRDRRCQKFQHSQFNNQPGKSRFYGALSYAVWGKPF